MIWKLIGDIVRDCVIFFFAHPGLYMGLAAKLSPLLPCFPARHICKQISEYDSVIFPLIIENQNAGWN